MFGEAGGLSQPRLAALWHTIHLRKKRGEICGTLCASVVTSVDP
jgi:hypothetical protein